MKTFLWEATIVRMEVFWRSSSVELKGNLLSTVIPAHWLTQRTDKIRISFKRKSCLCDRPKEIANSHFFYPISNNEGLTDDDTLCID